MDEWAIHKTTDCAVKCGARSRLPYKQHFYHLKLIHFSVQNDDNDIGCKMSVLIRALPPNSVISL